jgi:hypothetical protein
MYRRVATRAAGLAVRNWPVILSAFVYAAIMLAASMGVAFVAGRLGMLGMIGGLLLSFVWAACVASFLYLVEMIVRTGRVTLADFRRSFGVYLWDVMGVAFVLWLVYRFVTPGLATLPQAGTILIALNVLILVFCNAVPELIYLGHHSTLSLLTESYRFVSDNWIEWFPPNVVLLGILFLVNTVPTDGWLSLVQFAVTTLFVYYAMVVRGLLFLELHETSRRGRMFRYRMEH